MREINGILEDNGIWVFEQSYMPAMLEQNAYDTICHEHIEYYGLKQIKWMTDLVGLKIVKIERNSINGGSFTIVVAKINSSYTEASELVASILAEEKHAGLNTFAPFLEFRNNIFRHRDELVSLIHNIRENGQSIFGYGASTKGNVILQFCNITARDVPYIAEVNRDKFGCVTPGSLIPIISEAEAHAAKPDYFMVLPWHFRENILVREASFLRNGGKLLFPLPRLEVVKE